MANTALFEGGSASGIPLFAEMRNTVRMHGGKLGSREGNGRTAT